MDEVRRKYWYKRAKISYERAARDMKPAFEDVVTFTQWVEKDSATKVQRKIEIVNNAMKGLAETVDEVFKKGK